LAVVALRLPLATSDQLDEVARLRRYEARGWSAKVY